MGAEQMLREGWVLSLKLAGIYLAQTGLSKSGGHPIPLPRLVAVAYADWVPAEAPRPASVVEHACASRAQRSYCSTRSRKTAQRSSTGCQSRRSQH